MHRNAVRLLGLINQLLDLSKLDAGNMRLEFIESDIFRTVRVLTSSFMPLADRKKIEYDLKTPSGEYLTFFDPDKLEKIIANLLSNAFKYTPAEGYIGCNIKVVKRGKNKDKDFLSIVVEDSGPGIPAEMIDKIFDRFYQVEGSNIPQNVEGSGIGLSLTRELISLQHGQIKVESSEGEGTRFTVLLPLGKDHLKAAEFMIREPDHFEDSAIIPAIVARTGTGLTKPEDFLNDDHNGKPRILVVEDSEDVRAHLLENLNEQFLIEEAVDGEEGLQKACDTIPDLVISDLMMPKMDGVELCKNLKTDERTSHIPVLMLTAKATVESKIEGLETGADAYMTKPFNLQELIVQVNNLILQRKKLRDKFATSSDIGPSDIAVTSVDEKFLTKAIELIEENLGDCEFDVSSLTDRMGMSRMQLFRKLKALTNQNPSEFIRTIRLKRAAQLIKKKFGNVAEITYEVGFNNLSYFAKCFKELYGVSPSEYARA
jgi:DNA-binding response OmpR family regulator/two-component sensor histidine kinase